MTTTMNNPEVVTSAQGVVNQFTDEQLELMAAMELQRRRVNAMMRPDQFDSLNTNENQGVADSLISNLEGMLTNARRFRELHKCKAAVGMTIDAIGGGK